MPSLRLGLGLVLQDREEDGHMEVEEGCLTPVLVEGEGRGYFQLGPSTQDTARWGRLSTVTDMYEFTLQLPS